MRDYLAKRPMLLCSIICCFISVVGFYSNKSLILYGILTAIIIGGLFFYKAKPEFIFVGVFVFIMILSTVNITAKIKNQTKLDGLFSTAEAVVVQTENKNNYSVAVVEITESDIIASGSKINAYCYGETLKVGDYIKADFNLSKIENPYKASFYSNKIFLTANISDVSVLDKKDNLLVFFEDIREYIRKTIFSNTDYAEASTITALVFGDKSYFTNNFYVSVKRAGVAHSMVVSGMHLAIIVSLFTKSFEKFIYNRFLRGFTILAVVIILTAVCGFTMSMFRAGGTYIVAALGLMLNKDNTSENALGTATSVALIISPFAIFNVGFRLSVLSTFGILSVALPICDYIKRKELLKFKISQTILFAFIINVSATLFTMPTLINTYGEISIVSIIANLMISYFITLLLCFSVSALIINPIIPLISETIFSLCNLLAKIVNKIIEFFGGLSFSSVKVSKYVSLASITLIFIIFYMMAKVKEGEDKIKRELVLEKIYKDAKNYKSKRYFNIKK
ncbi:MAG: ComEC/Rec2 family competence protein [Clostridia bacterium]|nr:ComEC/Rec2 family competence protein [Clostridia bacterium]